MQQVSPSSRGAKGSTESRTPAPPRRGVVLAAGLEPIQGYRLLEPLGQGGFGEVWKCEAPGGLFKAIKFVGADDGSSCPATQERAALERVKLLRHPFILSLERLEEIDGTLVIIMELADQSLHARHTEYRDGGHLGVPRDELLGYLLEAAEALDWMNFQHGLQHLDVKPHNLFLVCGHVKVADFGLVYPLGEAAQQGRPDEAPGSTGEQQYPVRRGGVTPLYSAPELLRGTLSRSSDQYSLAVVYQQLLTGTVPFWHENTYELMMQHLCAEPDLQALPEEDRPVVGRALAKGPEQRYPSCMEFVLALVGGQGPTLRSGRWRRVLVGGAGVGQTPVVPSRRPDLQTAGGQTQPEDGSAANTPSAVPRVEGAPGSAQPPASPPEKAPPGRGQAPRTPNAPERGAGGAKTDTPTRRIRTLTPAQLAASEMASRGLAEGPSRHTFAETEKPRTPERNRSLPRSETPSSPTVSDEEEQSDLRPERPQPGRADRRTPVSPPQSVPAAEPREGSSLPTPTAVTLPGYRFLSCLNQTQFADLWRAEDGNGNPRRALCLLGFVRYDARLIGHLRALHDPALPVTEVHWSPAERLVVLTDSYEGTLRDRFEQRQAEGQAGIPRSELIALLRTAAEALDALYARHGLQHLGINPRNLLIDSDRLWLAEFGLIPLVWLPTGQAAAAINSKYASPELFDRKPSRSADQYALALIYAEMLTGSNPRPHRPGSGFYRRPGLPSSRPTTVSRSVKIDVDMLPATDREVVARALAHEPERRFPTCVAFIEALEQAGQETPAEQDLYHTLPPVIPYATLHGEPAGPDTVLPSVGQLVMALTTPTDPRLITGPQNARYLVQPDGSWEYRCPLQLFPGAMALKIEGLRAHWNAQVVQQEGDSYRLEIEVPVSRTFWERYLKSTRRVQVEVLVEAIMGSHSRLTEARVCVRYPESRRDQADRVLATMAPQVFETVRLYLQATPEQRTRERWPFAQPLHVYPVLPDLDLAPTLEGECRNLSHGGISFRVSEPLPTEYLYLHLHRSPQALGYAILAKVVRVQEGPDGVEIGAAFTEPMT